MHVPFNQAIRKVRLKIQSEHLLKGLALLAAFLLLASLLAAWVLVRHNFADGTLFWLRLLGGAGVLFILGRYLLLPLLRRPSMQRVARFLEERHPDLQDRLSTAVELQKPSSGVHPELRRLIERDASSKLLQLPQPRFYRPRLSLFSLAVAAVSLLTLSVLFVAGPEAYRFSVHKLLLGWYDADQPPLYWIQVEPGSASVGKHADLEVRAALHGFDSENVLLFARYANNPQWEHARMQPDPGGGDYVFLFFDLREPVDYYVEADGIRSPPFQIQVSEVPRVQKLEIVLDFPRYTGMKSLRLEDEGDIRALRGTRASVTVHTDQRVQDGLLKLEQGGEVPLTAATPTELKGSFEIRTDDFYRIHLRNSQGVLNPGSSEYIIEALQDQPPTVSFTTPGRDRRVTNLEEVFTEVKAEDDFALNRLSIRFSVNGGEEQEVALDLRPGSRSATSSYTFYLEEYALQPGDFVSYFAQASDAVTTASTDIYFLEVEPYDREFYQSQQSGSMGAGGGEPMDLARQQKQIVVATFKLDQERSRYAGSEFEENSQTLALVQQRLQTQVRTIAERIQRRGAAMSDPRFQKMVELMNQAAEHMEPAHKHLNELQPQAALPEEQKALQQLLRAESLFKEIQVSFAMNPGGGGEASAEQLADLVDLELDRTKNQYETIQQNRALSREQALDEALEKLKELARRQEQNVERMRRQGLQSSSGGGGSQNQIIEELEELARHLQRLSREQQDPQLAELSRQLNRAARDLRQSQSAGQDGQQAQMQAQQALERLQEAQRELGRQRQNQMSHNLQNLRERVEALARDQKEVLQQLRQVEEQYKAGQVNQDLLNKMRSLLRKKSEMQQELQELESELHQSARQLESKEKASARKLKEAGLNIRDQRIPEKMREGSELLARGWMDMAREREEGVDRHLQDLAEDVREAQQALGRGNGENPQERLQRAAEELGSLVDKLESLRERASAQQQGRPGQESPGDRQSPSQQNPPGETASPQGGERPGENARSGSAREGEADQTGQAAWSGPSANSYLGFDPSRHRREWQERLRDVEQIRQLLRDQPRLNRDVSELIRQMRQLDLERIFSDPEEVARLKSRIIDGFQQLELELHGALRENEGSYLRLANEDEIPPEFRERVEEYYRMLSRRRE